MTRKIMSAAMIVLGVGMVVFAFSEYSPDGLGWALSCRYMMSVGAILATGGRLIG